MKRVIFIILLTFNPLYLLRGQDADSSLKILETGNWLELSYQPVDEKGEKVPFIYIEEMPCYPGGFDALAKFIVTNLNYPNSAIKDSVQGRVLTSFIVNWEGKVVNVKTWKGVRQDLDSACVHVIELLPPWKPIKYRYEQKIGIRFLLPIHFILNESDLKKTTLRHNK